MPVRVTIALLAAIAISTVAASAQSVALHRIDYHSAAGARAVVAADFNRDGAPDVAHVNVDGNSVSVLLDAGRGERLTLAYSGAVGAGPFDVAAADVNRDGSLDLAVANADSHSIAVLTGRGDGRFVRAPDVLTAPLRGPRGIAAADMTGDGRIDLIYSAYDSGRVQLLVGAGTGRFTAGPQSTGTIATPQGVGVLDVDHDGRPEILVAGGDGLTVLRRGPSSLTPRVVPGTSALNVLAIGDLDGDGWRDVAAASSSTGRVGIYLGTRAGLVHRETYAVGAGPRGIAIADLDADGAPDIVTVSRTSSTVTVLRGHPAERGTFQAPLTFAAGSGSRAVAAADFNVDGRIDLVTGNQYARGPSVLWNDTLLEPAAFAFSRQGTRLTLGLGDYPNPIAADFNHDGAADVARMSNWPSATISVALSDDRMVALPAGLGRDLAATDVNGDGNTDLLFVGAGPVAGAYLGDGAGGFAAAPPSDFSAIGLDFVLTAVGDMTGDARPDVIAIGQRQMEDSWVGQMQILVGNGDGTFRLGGAKPLDGYPVAVTVGDVTRDGRLDVALLLRASRLELWRGDGAGGISGLAHALDFEDNGAGHQIELADVNHDGRLDALFDQHNGVIGIARGTASGFAPPIHLSDPSWGSFGGPSRIFAVADINADGHPDVMSLWGDFFAGRGDGTFGSNERFAFVVEGVQAAELTGDGVLDLLGVWGGEVVIIANRRTSSNRPPVLTVTGDRTVRYEEQWLNGWPAYGAMAVDPDLHRIRFEWRDAAGELLATTSGVADVGFEPPPQPPGTHEFFVTASDFRGGSTVAKVVLTVLPGGPPEIVLHVDNVTATGHWTLKWDESAAQSVSAYNWNDRRPKVTAPLAAPASSVTLLFVADPARTYKLWMRLKADANHWANDSVWVQFSGATDARGAPVFRTGTTSGLAVNLEECAGCGLSGWGWEDDGWGAVNHNGVTLRFPGGGLQSIVVQTREDGVAFDQVVLSSEKYLTARPGTARNDTTIVPRTLPPSAP